MTKSEIFTQYNKARSAGVLNGLDPKRVNRALGLLQRKDGGEGKLSDYRTTVKSCGCMDSQMGNTCKHRIVRMIEYKIETQEISESTPVAGTSKNADGKYSLLSCACQECRRTNKAISAYNVDMALGREPYPQTVKVIENHVCNNVDTSEIKK